MVGGWGQWRKGSTQFCGTFRQLISSVLGSVGQRCSSVVSNTWPSSGVVGAWLRCQRALWQFLISCH